MSLLLFMPQMAPLFWELLYLSTLFSLSSLLTMLMFSPSPFFKKGAPLNCVGVYNWLL